MNKNHFVLRAVQFATATYFSLCAPTLLQAQINSTNIAGTGTLQPTASFAAIIAGNTATNGGTNSAIIGAANSIVPGGTRFAFIGAGNFNNMAAGSHSAAMLGGFSNTIVSGGVRGVTVGGGNNTNAGRSAVILGGEFNIVGVNSTGAAVIGGLFNEALAPGATVPGGISNVASGTNSFAAGSFATATNNGTFVWADSSSTADFISTANNQYLIRAAGGVGINTNDLAGNALRVLGATELVGSLAVRGQIISGNNNTANGTFASVAGGEANSASATFSSVGGGVDNVASGPSSTVGGGFQNTATGSRATVSGGWLNLASGEFSTVGGGQLNSASGDGSFIGSGFRNVASGSNSAVVAGWSNAATAFSANVSAGYQNSAIGGASTVSGGGENVASGLYATVPGGLANQASGDGALAMGVLARATHTTSFVWGGTENFFTDSFGPQTFTVSAPGGARFYSVEGFLIGPRLAAGGTDWVANCDSNLKTAVTAIDPRTILSKLASLPVSSWKYKHNPKRHYIGPMAQDFFAAFGLGEDATGISTLDADGVAFAAIQGLVEELKDRDKAMAARDKTIEDLREKLQAIEERLSFLPPSP